MGHRLRTMLAVLTVAAGLVAMAAPASALATDEARHLLARTGFGASPQDIAGLRDLDRRQAVDKLLAGIRTEPSVAPPAWTAETRDLYPVLNGLGAEERQRVVRQANDRSQELKAWWYAEMLATPSPFSERMTLFWHNHFTSSLRKVRAPVLHYRQNALLRRHAFGNFAVLLRDIARDPVMLDYLDNRLNRWERPNENFARELLELFTLGEGYYTEQDIKEAARALTGWTTDRERERFVENPRLHDPDSKTFLGRRGRFDGDDILKILLETPRTAEFVVEKLWREFVSPTPDPVEVKRLAAAFRDGKYEIKPVMRALLTSDAFWSPANRGELIKSPVEFLVGTVRFFERTPADAATLARYGRRLGQDVFDPPNVKGWPGHTAWITSDTLLVREQFLLRLLRGDPLGGAPANAAMGGASGNAMMAGGMAPPAMAAPRRMPEVRLERIAQATASESELATLLLAKPPVNPPPEAGDLRARLAALMLDPVYHLK